MKKFSLFLSSVLRIDILICSAIVLYAPAHAQNCGGNCAGIGGYSLKTTTAGAPIKFVLTHEVPDGPDGEWTYSFDAEALTLKRRTEANGAVSIGVAQIPGMLAVTEQQNMSLWPMVNGFADYKVLLGGGVRIKPDATWQNAFVHISAPMGSNQMMIGYEPLSENYSSQANEHDALFWTGGSGPVAHTVITNTRGGAIKFATGTGTGNDAQRMIIDNNGLVGIGRQPNASYRVAVDGWLHSNRTIAANNGFKLINSDAKYEFSHGGSYFQTDASNGIGIHTGNTQRMIITNDGRVGIGRQPEAWNRVSVEGGLYSTTWLATRDMVKLHNVNGKVEFHGGGEYIASDAAWGLGLHTQNGTRRLYIYNDGRVQIGDKAPTNQAYRLGVDGAIVGQKLVATAVSNWADFVFDETYTLPGLQEVENYVINHKHLPGIPSESEVMENGIDTADMMAKLLQKVEELTLYTIRQQKEIDALKAAQK